MSTLTTQEAAELCGVSVHAVRWWVKQGQLQPVRAHAKPVRYAEEDVIGCWLARRPAGWSERLDRLAQEWGACG